jgi:hypothetical protein
MYRLVPLSLPARACFQALSISFNVSFALFFVHYCTDQTNFNAAQRPRAGAFNVSQ